MGDNNIQRHLEWVTCEIQKYESYHNHKELMAWLATAFYVTGIITLGFYLSNDVWIRALVTFGLLLVGYLVWIFVNMQFNMRWIAADIQKGLTCFASHLCFDTVTLPTAPTFTPCEKGSEDEKWEELPDHIRQFIKNEAEKVPRKKCEAVKNLLRRPCSLDNRWKTELPSYSLIIIATVVALISLWLS